MNPHQLTNHEARRELMCHRLPRWDSRLHEPQGDEDAKGTAAW